MIVVTVFSGSILRHANCAKTRRVPTGPLGAVLGTVRNNQTHVAALVTDQRHLPDVLSVPQLVQQEGSHI
jgi:hypothetical protein